MNSASPAVAAGLATRTLPWSSHWPRVHPPGHPDQTRLHQMPDPPACERHWEAFARNETVAIGWCAECETSGVPGDGVRGENTFRRTRINSIRLDKQVPTSHLSHVEPQQGDTADATTPKQGEMVRRSTPYALHDGTVGLYFLAFARSGHQCASGWRLSTG